MDIYATTNQKGGVGKTTVTLRLSAELARRASRVLVIDLDPQASATKVLAADVEDRHTVADVMLEPNVSGCSLRSFPPSGDSTWRRPRRRSPHESNAARRRTSSPSAASWSRWTATTWC